MTAITKIKNEIQKVLDKERDFSSENAKAQAIALMWCLDIIDKYAEQEPMDHDSVSRGYLLGLANKDGAYGYISAHEIVNAPSLNRQEPSEDAVSRQAVLEILQDYVFEEDEIESVTDECQNNMAESIARDIVQLPSVKPQEPKTGKWEDLHICWICSECNQETHIEYKFCPNCGCRMVEPQESEDEE